MRRFRLWLGGWVFRYLGVLVLVCVSGPVQAKPQPVYLPLVMVRENCWINDRHEQVCVVDEVSR